MKQLNWNFIDQVSGLSLELAAKAVVSPGRAPSNYSYISFPFHTGVYVDSMQ